MNQITGQIIYIGDVNQVTEKLAKRIFTIKTNEQYPQEIPFELINGAVGNTDGFNVGETAEVHFNLKGRADKNNKTKWYPSLNAWKLIKKQTA